MKKFALLFSMIGLLAYPAFADETVAFGPDTSQIKGSIKYTVVGRYNAVFDQYEGSLTINKGKKEINAVFLEIKSASINSSHPSLDKIVRSKQLLNVEKFPVITFQSKTISQAESGYRVVGDLTLHGVTKEITSPFSADFSADGTMTVKGQWLIKRKEFGIIWNRLLDKGGILVGDIITVKWEIKIPKGVVE